MSVLRCFVKYRLCFMIKGSTLLWAYVEKSHAFNILKQGKNSYYMTNSMAFRTFDFKINYEKKSYLKQFTKKDNIFLLKIHLLLFANE